MLSLCSAAAASPQPTLDASIRRTMLDATTAPLDPATTLRPAQQQAAAVAALQRAAAELQAGGYERCGAAAAVCLAAPGCLTAAWAGDCRAVAGVCMADGSLQALALTQDHKPDSPLERARIEATPAGRVKQTAGGARLMDGSLGWQEALAAKSLGLSRALGDTSYTPLGLTAEPDAATLCLPPAPTGRRHVLIVASDGLWEVVGSGKAVAAAAACATPAAAAAALADLSRRRGVACKGGRVLDDCTVAVAFVA
ncbi:phosphatase 2C 6 [Chlorella sorokiniana]|uniref:Phosphatase 2C 6 n=1 Tax=Chlorella sorokiniana TaxID=3076 RepID=A0A2P6TES0_CHLSO|nr:phosphatase 2C 6 [Chlorella sorokiniana]|eukprot:PRW21141.1 phosphatase 2C 6 [Chlorella sorokiniana]